MHLGTVEALIKVKGDIPSSSLQIEFQSSVRAAPHEAERLNTGVADLRNEIISKFNGTRTSSRQLLISEVSSGNGGRNRTTQAEHGRKRAKGPAGTQSILDKTSVFTVQVHLAFSFQECL